jgi:hypothetical protein
MKIRTSIRAGGNQGCSPEAQLYMQKALNMEYKIDNCINRQGNPPPYTPQPIPNPSGYAYPDRSGWCG